MDAVLAGLDGKGTIGNADAVLAGQSLAGGSNGIGAAGYSQVIFGYDPMTSRRRDGQGAAAVEGEVTLGKDSGVNVVVIYGDITVPASELRSSGWFSGGAEGCVPVSRSAGGVPVGRPPPKDSVEVCSGALALPPPVWSEKLPLST